MTFWLVHRLLQKEILLLYLRRRKLYIELLKTRQKSGINIAGAFVAAGVAVSLPSQTENDIFVARPIDWKKAKKKSS